MGCKILRQAFSSFISQKIYFLLPFTFSPIHRKKSTHTKLSNVSYILYWGRGKKRGQEVREKRERKRGKG